ncbi:MAG TPA: hypothetical protein VG167_18970 [Verrucomicrobiae bacterium]|nr:hypothetical protein [Verrucomicrobiae bacterium]
MGLTVIDQSHGREAIQSPGRELDGHVQPSITIQRMKFRKVWAGLAPGNWLPAFYGLQGPPPSRTDQYGTTRYFYPAGWRSAFRSKYSLWTIRQQWSAWANLAARNVAVDSTGTMGLSAGGNCPVNNGIFNIGVNDDGSLTQTPWTVYRPGDAIFDWGVDSPFVQGNIVQPGGPGDPTGGWSSSVTQRDFGGLGFDYSFVDNGGTHACHFSIAETGPIPFSSTLGAVLAYFPQLQWQAFPVNFGNGISEMTPICWSEWMGSSGDASNPNIFSGNPVVGDPNLFLYSNPYFGFNASDDVGAPPYSPHLAQLWSGWFWYPNSVYEEFNGGGVSGGTASFDNILGQRVRFMSNNAVVPYFIATAIATRPPYTGSEWPAQDTRSRDDITNVKLITSGVAVPGQIIEVPWLDSRLPGSGDFIDVQLPLNGYETLSAGAFVFCSIGETASGFTARTGIPVG